MCLEVMERHWVTNIKQTYRLLLFLITNMADKRPSSSGGTALTAALVISKTKSDSLQNIKNLNLWGNDLEDLRLLREMPSLEVVSLSVNRISTLKEFGYCPKLKELYLRKNTIKDIRQIKYLIKLPNLTVLWLHDNPCATIPNYREVVIKFLPKLLKLDNSEVSAEERARAQKLPFSLNGYEMEEEVNDEEYQHISVNKRDERASNELETPNRQEPRRERQDYPELQDRQREQHQIQKPGFGRTGQARKEEPHKQVREERPHSTPFVHEGVRREQPRSSSKNILLAVVSLLKELDGQSLELVRAEVDKLLQE